MLNIQVLISCMYQEDTSIIQRTNVKSDVVVVNQCEKKMREEFDFYDSDGKKHHAIFISTKERGLSRSRNMAIENSTADICKICDDDEILNDTYVSDILSVYEQFPKLDVILFNFHGKNDRCFKSQKKISWSQILKSASIQITFRCEKVKNKQIDFDVELGSGTGNGGGEENKFLLDCRKKKLKITTNFKYVTRLNSTGKSLWFDGHNEKYFFNLGWSSRRIFGSFVSFIYIIYYPLTHRFLYRNNLSLLFVLRTMFKGYFSRRNKKHI